MGGFGSGQRWSKKGTVEQRYSLDTVSMKRWNMLVPGTVERVGSFLWERGEPMNSAVVSYLLTVEPSAGTLRLLYSMKSQDANLDYPVRLVTTPCRLGGVRWWFICPLTKNGVPCGRRVRKLYLCGKYFGCRHCHDLTYQSSQESDSRVYALLRSGLPPDGWDNIQGMSGAQLGFALKVLDFEQKQLERICKQPDRSKKGKRTAENF